jgi:hypothetical protein
LEIEITNAGIGSRRRLSRFTQCGEKLLVDIVEDAGKCGHLVLSCRGFYAKWPFNGK